MRKLLPAALALLAFASPLFLFAAQAGASEVVWVDDALPAGATAQVNGDAWNWISSAPTPVSGTSAHQSNIAAGLHEHYFTGATSSLAVATGDILTASVFLDPANPPSEIMLQWTDGASWEHRAFWGSDSITYGTSGTASRLRIGVLPAAGGWVQLQVPAKAVGLEGHTLTGMAFSQFNGRAAWDRAGKLTGTLPVLSVWVDEKLPSGAVPAADGGDGWSWINANPTPCSGLQAHQSNLTAGLHEHYFSNAAATQAVHAGDVLFAYVYLDPANPPSEVMLEWNAGSWEHRAYWGANSITYGTSGTVSRQYMGALPAAGQWVLLQVPAKQVGLEGQILSGMGFTLFGGRATWDMAGDSTAAIVSTTLPAATPPAASGSTGSTGSASGTTLGGSAGGSPSTTTTTSGTTGTTGATITDGSVWVDDALPAGATGYSDGGDAWNWVSANPAPASGTVAHQSAVAAGLHEHYFNYASTPLAIATGSILYTYVYLDPANPPTEIMLEWNAGNWEHRAYWGANSITYGTDGTAGRRSMGALPPAGQWVLLQVPASQVGLEGQSVTGMGYSLYGGRATWDDSGAATSITAAASGSGSSGSGSATSRSGAGSGSSGTSATTLATSTIDDLNLQLPAVGTNTLHVISPTVLELVLINSKQPDPAQVSTWNFVNASGQFTAPATSKFTVTVGGQVVQVQAVGFKRRVEHAPVLDYDLRIQNSLYLQLASPVAAGAAVTVTNADASLWPATMQFTTTADPMRYSPALHVNQEGYGSALPKKAMVGYYLGNLGELSLSASTSFSLVDAATGSTVYTGSLSARPDVGYVYTPTPYQQVLQADFSSFTTPGKYQLVVPGLGASIPFLINDGIPLGFMRTYALGIYAQRCGHSNSLPFTRFTKDACHTAPAQVPVPQSSFSFTWTTIQGLNANYAKTDPADVGPELVSQSTQLYPFVNTGSIDVSGGHHDAGDYSKYTINSATLIHYLMFAVDNIPGVAAMDNLGLPESGDGISDVMQEAKWEADYLAKLQDADGGFYFLVYPKNRQYESNVLPDDGDPQVVFPKNTSATAASVAALAQIASSPLFKRTYPAASALYLQKAQLGWQFLMNAIAKYGKDGSYQMVTFYGDDWIHNDELAWAACEMYLATGNPTYQTQLFSWFPNPADPATFRWGWWRMAESWGCAIRDYAFAAKNGRLSTSQLDASYLASCQGQVVAAGNDALSWSQQNAYGTAFPPATKAVQGAGWYFSLDQASDMAVAYQLNPDPKYLEALVGNMNYEGGTNPVNVCYVTGLGQKRQQEIVSQYSQNDRRVLPVTGIPLGNIQSSFDYLSLYQGELASLSFPSDSTGANPLYPYYDRWADAYNVTTEFITVNQARSLVALSALAAQSAPASQPWTSAAGQITVPTGTVPLNAPVTLSFSAPGVDLTNARIVWEARDQNPAFGSTYTISPVNNGAQWVEVEAELPDGRRINAATTFNADGAVVNWVNGGLPSGLIPGSGSTTSGDGGDGWTWTSSNPTPNLALLDHQSNLASGEHEHWFITSSDWGANAKEGTNAGMAVNTGDTLFAYVYLDPANPPTEVMLGWYDGSGWEHRAYWGANSITWGSNGTAGRTYAGPLPAAGQWVKLSVPASAVGMEGVTASGLCYSLYGGRATWDTAGKNSAH